MFGGEFGFVFVIVVVFVIIFVVVVGLIISVSMLFIYDIYNGVMKGGKVNE